jgi:hypothetical protein
MKKQIAVVFICLMCFVAQFCIAQTKFKVGVCPDGNYKLVEGTEGVGYVEISCLLLKATGHPRSDFGTQIIMQIANAAEMDDEVEAAHMGEYLENVIGQYLPITPQGLLDLRSRGVVVDL